MPTRPKIAKATELSGSDLLTLIEDRCKGCTHCLRVCPTEAIRVRSGKARKISHRCIDCGECIRVCPWKAWVVAVDPRNRGQREGSGVAVLDPAVFGQFGDRVSPAQILEAFQTIGFSWAKAMSEGLILYRRAVRRYLSSGRAALPAISSDCPAIVQLVQVKFPSLLENLVPVAATFEIMASFLQKTVPGEMTQELVYIVPCLAKARAATESRIPGGAYHRAIPIVDLYSPLHAWLHSQEPKGSPEAGEALSSFALDWAAPGGLSRALGLPSSLVVDGVKEVAEVLELAENGLLEGVPLVEAWSCRGGCLGGSLNVKNPFWARYQLSSRTGMAVELDRLSADEGAEKKNENDYFLPHPFSPRPGMRLDEDLHAAMEKLRRIDEVVKRFPGIDCGSCGSPNCLALAEDVVQGNAREMDCISILKELNPAEALSDKGVSRDRRPKPKRKRR